MSVGCAPRCAMHSGATRLVAPMLRFAPGSAARCRQASPAAGCMQNPWPVGKRCTSAHVPAACGCVAVSDMQPLIAPLHGCLAGAHGSSTAGDRRRVRKCDRTPLTSAAPPLTLPQERRVVPATQEAMGSTRNPLAGAPQVHKARQHAANSHRQLAGRRNSSLHQHRACTWTSVLRNRRSGRGQGCLEERGSWKYCIAGHLHVAAHGRSCSACAKMSGHAWPFQAESSSSRDAPHSVPCGPARRPVPPQTRP